MSDLTPDRGEPEEQLEEAPLLSHLIELRTRLMRAMAAVFLILVCLAPFAGKVFSLVAQPLIHSLPAGSTMIATQVTGTFMTPLKTAFFVALFLAMPYVLYQAWAFVAPGLYRREKRFAVPLLVSSVVLFYVGVCFAWFVVFPIAFAFFAAVAPQGVTMMTDINSFLDFAVLTLFSFGAAFEVPVATVLLVASGLVTVEQLAKQRSMVGLGSCVVAAIFTPPDVMSMILLWVPLYLLFEAGLLMARFMLPHRVATARAADDPAA
jgi:sec-independent protein translocase protein TatC